MTSKIDKRESAGNKHVLTTYWRIAPYHEIIADLVARYAPPGARVLDVGCGMGQVEHLLAPRRPDINVSVVDAYQVCLDSCKEIPIVKTAALVDETTFNIDEVTSGVYDVVFMSHVLEHLLDPTGGLRKVMSRVADHGYCLLAVPNPTRPDILVGNVFQRHYVNRGHVVSWDPSHWRNFLERIMGLKVERHLSDYIVFPGALKIGPLRSISKYLATVVPWWGRSNISVIKKEPGWGEAPAALQWDTSPGIASR